MSDELVFYTNPMTRGRIVRWMLEEIGAPYRAELLDLAGMKAPGFVAVNPMAKVPAITHRGRTVTEVAAICAYLADAFPAAGLAPPPADRADYYRWLFFAAGPFEAAITNQVLGFEVPEARSAMVGYGNSAAAVLDTLEAAIGARDYVAGEAFSAADVYVGSQLRFQLQFGSIEARPAFTAYVGRLDERPAFRRASEIDDALLPPKG